ncbi:transcription and mRNA export factor Sus1p [Monosporozyma unispora]
MLRASVKCLKRTIYPLEEFHNYQNRHQKFNMDGNVKAQIQKYLVESGNYEKISNALTEKLLQEGWVDKVKNLTMEEINKNDKAGYTDVLSKVEPMAMSMVTFETKASVMQQIKGFLDDIIETE